MADRPIEPSSRRDCFSFDEVVLRSPLTTHRRRSTSANEVSSLRTLDKTTLLLIDDMLFSLDVMQSVCTKMRWEFHGAETAKQGLKKVAENDYDVILCDHNLDSGNKGDVVAKQIRDLKPHLLIFSFSGDPIHNEEYKGRDLWDGIYGKKISIKRFHEVVVPKLLETKATWKT